MTVIETPQFARQADEVWTASERHAFIDHIARNPQAGDLIAGTGGVPKLRWSRPGIGKRGGVRVIYFCHQPTTPLYLLMIYAKAMREDLAPEAKRAAADFAARIKRTARGQQRTCGDEPIQS